MKEFKEELSKLVSIPSISSDPEYEEEIRKCASLLEKKLKKLGANVEIIETPGNPLIIGSLKNHENAETVAIYNHYDVQPIASPEEWETRPFELEEKNGKYCGRGASDDKGNLLAVLKAVEVAVEKDLPLNFQFIYEGEEESGSPNFEEGLEKAKDMLDPDAVLVADGGWLSKENPSVEYGLRGILYMHWNLRTADKNSHSGAVGGPARNPLLELFEAASGCIDSGTGEIQIPGVYGNVKEPSQEEIEYWKKSEFNVEQFKESHHLRKLRFEDRVKVLKAIWARPTFEIHGCIGGCMKKDATMTVMPGDGQLLVSMRLVPDQDPQRILELVRNHVKKINPEIEIKKAGCIEPYLTDFESKSIEAAAKSLKEVFDLPVAVKRAGGSIGAVPIMNQLLGNPEIIVMAFSLPEDNAHAPNESFDKGQAKGAIKSYLNYFRLLSGT